MQARKGVCWLAQWLLLAFLSQTMEGKPARTGADLQALLDQGKDLVLRSGEVIEVDQTLKVTHSGQGIYTESAQNASEYGTIRHGEGSSGTLLEGHGVAGLRIHDLILDANRSGFRSAEGILRPVPMISLGGAGSAGQEIRRCIVVNARSAGGWGAIHIQEGGEGIVVEDNVVFSAGVDIRGNGRSAREKPYGWGDGISTASRGTLIRNNVIYDATDEGIMVQGGPGSKVQGNVIVAVSRELFGGIALIDPFGYFRLEPSEAKRYDYRGVLIEGNWIHALGGRIHVGLPMGGDAWHPNLGGTTLIGATVRNNRISGKAMGYGYVANGIDGFIIEGNRSEAFYSGIGDGLRDNPPDEPAAFLYNPTTVGESELQSEFEPAQKHVTKILRSDRGGPIPTDPLGYREVGYGAEEAMAVVEGAYLEMLGRAPSGLEQENGIAWLHATHANADALRIQLMSDPDFTDRFGHVHPLDLNEWRGSRWLQLIRSTCSDKLPSLADRS